MCQSRRRQWATAPGDCDSIEAPAPPRAVWAGDEALYLVSCDARSDIRELFDQQGQLLPMHQWPDSIAVSVKSIQPGPFGVKVVLNDKLAARRIILEQTGKLKSPVADGVDALAEAIKANLALHAPKE